MFTFPNEDAKISVVDRRKVSREHEISLRRNFATRNHTFMTTIEASLTGLRFCFGFTFDLEGLAASTGLRDAHPELVARAIKQTGRRRTWLCHLLVLSHLQSVLLQPEEGRTAHGAK